MKRKIIFPAVVLSMVALPALANASLPSEIPKQPGQISNSFIVKYEDSSKEAKQINSQPDSEVHLEKVSEDAKTSLDKKAEEIDAKVKTAKVTNDGSVKLTLDRNLSTSEAKTFAEELEKDPTVEYAEPNLIMRPTVREPNDAYYPQMWNLHKEGAGLDLMGAWQYTKGRGSVVAVVDTGITYHPDLNANVLPGYDFISEPYMSRDYNGRDPDARDVGDWALPGECIRFGTRRGNNSSWHGSHVAGTIAAVSNNGIGITGVAPESKIVPVRALGRCGGLMSDIADSITWASGGHVNNVPRNQHPADVINLSLGGYSPVCPRTYQKAIDEAVARGSTVVVAAGNERMNTMNSTPANCNNVIVVGAVGSDGVQASYSNYGQKVDISAQGGDLSRNKGVISTVNTGRRSPAAPAYAAYQGTSMATPHVSGVVALMKSINKNMTQDQVKRHLVSNTKRITNCYAGWGMCGRGLLDANAVLSAMPDNRVFNEEPAPVEEENVKPSPVADEGTIADNAKEPAKEKPAPKPQPSDNAKKPIIKDFVRKGIDFVYEIFDFFFNIFG